MLLIAVSFCLAGVSLSLARVGGVACGVGRVSAVLADQARVAIEQVDTVTQTISAHC